MDVRDVSRCCPRTRASHSILLEKAALEQAIEGRGGERGDVEGRKLLCYRQLWGVQCACLTAKEAGGAQTLWRRYYKGLLSRRCHEWRLPKVQTKVPTTLPTSLAHSVFTASLASEAPPCAGTPDPLAPRLESGWSGESSTGSASRSPLSPSWHPCSPLRPSDVLPPPFP